MTDDNKPISYGSPDAWGGANIRQIGAKNRERQALIDCYKSGQIDTETFLYHCNADPELLKMWENQRDDK